VGVRVKEKTNGKWRIDICHRGKRKTITVSDRKTALEVARKLEARLALGLTGLDGSESPTFREYAMEWLQTYAAVYTKPRTVEFYETVLRHHLLPTLGGLRLSELSRERVRTLVADRADAGLARGTLAGIVATLRAICNQAVEEGKMAQNPAARLGRFYRGQTEKEGRQADAFTEWELALVLKTAERDCPEQFDLIATAAWTGMRLGEVLGLQWPDIDFEGCFIEVRRTVYWRGKGLQSNSPKSGKGRRVVIPQVLAARLRQRRDILTAQAALEGREPSVWVFPNRAGNPQDGINLLKRTWYPLLAKAGLRRLSLHALRHTYSSLLIQRGESLAFIKQQLGHASIQTTVDVYGHLVPGDNREGLDRLADATGRNNLQRVLQTGSGRT
jgi:integrase